MRRLDSRRLTFCELAEIVPLKAEVDKKSVSAVPESWDDLDFTAEVSYNRGKEEKL